MGQKPGLQAVLGFHFGLKLEGENSERECLKKMVSFIRKDFPLEKRYVSCYSNKKSAYCIINLR